MGARVALVGNISAPSVWLREVKHELERQIELSLHSVTFCVKYAGLYAFRQLMADLLEKKIGFFGQFCKASSGRY